MKIAVSGASGFVGRALCSRLEQAGHSVFCLSRSIASDELEQQRIAWDPSKGLANAATLNGFDALIHLAGKTIAGRWTAATKTQIRDSRVLATQRLAAQLAELETPPSTILSASAVGIYGSDSQDEPWREGSELVGSDFLTDVAKGWESACDPLREVGLRVVHPRLGIVFGQDGGALQKSLPLFRWGLGGKIGNGQQIWSWISIRDCVSALIWLLENANAQGPYNLVSPNAVTNAEFTNILARELGRPAFLPAPAPMLRLVLGEMADALLLSSCHVVPKRLVEEGFQFQDAQLEDCLEYELA